MTKMSQKYRYYFRFTATDREKQSGVKAQNSQPIKAMMKYPNLISLHHFLKDYCSFFACSTNGLYKGHDERKELTSISRRH